MITLWMLMETHYSTAPRRHDTDWDSVLKLPWRAISYLAVEVATAVGMDVCAASTSRMNHFFHGSRVQEHVIQLHKTAGYTQTHPLANVKYVLQFDKGERKGKSFTLASGAQRDLQEVMWQKENESIVNQFMASVGAEQDDPLGLGADSDVGDSSDDET